MYRVKRARICAVIIVLFFLFQIPQALDTKNKIKEGMYINWLKPSLNKQVQSLKTFAFDMNVYLGNFIIFEGEFCLVYDNNNIVTL